MRHSHLGIIGAAALLSAANFAAIDPVLEVGSNRKKRRATKPSGQPIPEGTMTRQQRRAAERRALKDLPRP